MAKLPFDGDETPAASEFAAAYQAGVNAGVLVASEETLNPLDKSLGVRFVVLAGEQRVERVEHPLPLPHRKKGSVALKDADSFARFVKEQRTPESRLYANPDGTLFTCVFNHHGGMEDEADWCDYQAVFALQASTPWTTWVGANRKSMTQQTFAEFVEDNLPDVVEPDGATLLTAATHLEAKKTVHFKSGVTLANGAYKLTYEEDVEQRSKGDLTIPSRLVLGLAPFRRGPVYKVEARLRYRIASDALTFSVILDGVERIVEQAFDDAVAKVAELTGMEVFLGVPPTSR